MGGCGGRWPGQGLQMWGREQICGTWTVSGLEGCGGRRTHPQEKEMKHQGPWGKEGGSSGA